VERFPLQQLYRTNVVVSDLRVTARNYAEIFGINRWRVVHHTPRRLTDTRAFGFAGTFGYSTATGSNAQHMTFQLVQPTEGFSTFTEFLITRGAGVHSICVSRLDAPELVSLRAWLADEGIGVAQAGTLDGSVRQVYFDTRAALGGYYLEVTVQPVPEEEPPADELWDFEAEIQRPPHVNVLQHSSGVGHFGVAVPNVMDSLRSYARLLGLQQWRAVHFHPGAGSLEYSTLDGRHVEHAFLLAVASREDVSFEILQGIRGPTDYAAFIERTGGPGIHHLLLARSLPECQWLPLRSWMESMNVPVLMSGRTRSGTSEFYYLDTRDKLGGYLFEVIVSHPSRHAVEPESARVSADPLGRFDLDLSRTVDDG
jgi:hypothetical protein